MGTWEGAPRTPHGLIRLLLPRNDARQMPSQPRSDHHHCLSDPQELSRRSFSSHSPGCWQSGVRTAQAKGKAKHCHCKICSRSRSYRRPLATHTRRYFELTADCWLLTAVHVNHANATHATSLLSASDTASFCLFYYCMAVFAPWHVARWVLLRHMFACCSDATPIT